MEVTHPQWRRVVARLFGVEPDAVSVREDELRVGSSAYRLDRGVILLDDRPVSDQTERGTGEDVRRSFSEEWEAYGAILPEHEQEFSAYFDVVDLKSLASSLVIDLGCGSGRWSAKIAAHCDAIVLVDFSDAIFVARRNLEDVPNAVFFRGDVTSLPFANDSVDFLFSLGVLHHLDSPCLPAARELMRLGPRGLFYLYYALDNRPVYYRGLLRAVTATRRSLGRVHSESTRRRLSRAVAWGVYRPMVGVGSVTARMGVRAPIPLYESYKGKSIARIEQDAYDRFFTSIEQRVSRDEIRHALSGFEIAFSPQEPFWHFLVTREPGTGGSQ